MLLIDLDDTIYETDVNIGKKRYNVRKRIAEKKGLQRKKDCREKIKPLMAKDSKQCKCDII